MKSSISATFFVIIVFIVAIPVFAEVDINCSYSSQLEANSYSFNVVATSDNSCKSQLLRISVSREGKPFAQLATPYESIVEKASIVDIDDDGRHELIVISRDPVDEAKKSMALFVLDGNVIRQVKLPASPDMTGYRGGDTFQSDGGRIVRIFPVYLARDVTGNPTGGERRVAYQYRNKELLLSSATDAVKQATPATKERKKVVGKIKKGSIKIKGINPKADYIEIEADGSLENYKVVRIDDPWRLIIDIASAGSGMKEKTVVINRHGISTARIGEHKGYLRIVFDSSVSPMPTETITPVEHALRIGFYGTASK